MSLRQPLLDTLRAAHLRLGMAAVIAAGLVLTLVSFLTLRSQVEQNLTLVARSISYTAEAAAVFGDAAAATEVLQLVGERENLRAASLVDASGRQLASYAARNDELLDAALANVAGLLFGQEARASISHQGRPYGEVHVQGRGVGSLMYLLKVLAAIAVCTAANAWLVARLSRRIEQDIVWPLNRLAALTRTARTERALSLRAPAATVKEIHDLGEDFNALLAEIQSREASLVAKHETLRTVNESLSYLAFHDNLTGLPNRASFLDRAGRLVTAPREPGESCALLFLDCDRFKEVNDALGHAAGDELLVQVARRIRSKLRDGDFVARLGGDEFAVLLSPIRAAEDAQRIAAGIAVAIQAPMDSAAFGRIEASASVGVAMLPEAGGSLEQWLAAADAAMYRAKARSRGSVELFEARIDDEVRPLVA
ncbi:MAG TPA: diguanylate cyclase [Piscinibacter sp.]|jgi:diguanylate cyclase (GGDEF)-like protein|uniref:sensor domain-containing diguanylate cyclase n=1 Tax=Piscinibacter sp. TaxID=1903157 RepID=UPI001B61EB8E|nr:sensor domain-containing diguanylate cyclase [Piscinibacter sp.]MBK7531856.1 diguanylate cyclase [Piscinibacter sp.]MBL0092071.1 diguanylate cyclase [Piscinibacter sp.]MBP6544882.1 diguanylate cyclase [Piscinibacter sp.]HNW62291.1 diguanylate cyclase [Piscinibacter sp.]HOY34281.1 diguanylate cyclase [Piscinibacter sp.]